MGSDEYSCSPLRMRSRSTYSAGLAFMILAIACHRMHRDAAQRLYEFSLRPEQRTSTGLNASHQFSGFSPERRTWITRGFTPGNQLP